MSKKIECDLQVTSCEQLTPSHALLKLACAASCTMPQARAGQFVQVAVPNSKTTFLRRPISINRIDERGQLWLLVRRAGDGTNALANLATGAVVNAVLPLGNGFTVEPGQGSTLLVGGGVGVAPLLMLGEQMKRQGASFEFLLGAKTAAEVLELDEFKELGAVHVATEDGSMGVKGFVTQHPALASGNVQRVACCGPLPMMKAVAAVAKRNGAECEVSLENMMACGLGACLCCVEDTADAGNVCVCKEGPVFNINRLKW